MTMEAEREYISAMQATYYERDKIPLCCGTCLFYILDAATGMRDCEKHPGLFPVAHGVCSEWAERLERTGVVTPLQRWSVLRTFISEPRNIQRGTRGRRCVASQNRRPP